MVMADEMFQAHVSRQRMEMKELEEMFSKLKPPSLTTPNNRAKNVYGRYIADNIAAANKNIGNKGQRKNKKKGYHDEGRKMRNKKVNRARDAIIRRTVYVANIDHQITEELLAALFLSCGQVVDCRMCGDPKSPFRFAFVEFTDEEDARAALKLSGTLVGYYPVKVLPSKTAIAPVNPTFLPQTWAELEMCARTVYVTNIDKKVSREDLKLFFETICGKVYRLRILGDHQPSRIAFVEFAMAEIAVAALNCSGAVLGTLAIRISPSKTPVRSRAPRPTTRS